MHEVLHALGFVPACAPHTTANGHVSDPPNDLMYAGNQPWDIAHMVLDAGQDDYFQHAQTSRDGDRCRFASGRQPATCPCPSSGP